MKRTIKWHNTRKGYGFIEGEDKKNIFVHRNSIPEGIYLNEGAKLNMRQKIQKRAPKQKNKEAIDYLKPLPSTINKINCNLI